MYLERVEKRKDVIWGKGRIEYNGETTTGLGLFEIISMDRERENGAGNVPEQLGIVPLDLPANRMKRRFCGDARNKENRRCNARNAQRE